MKKPIYITLAFVSCIALLFSCKKDEAVESNDFGYNYVSDEVGRYIVYQVDSISIDDIANKRDTVCYLLKEQIAGVFKDNSGRNTLRLERCVKKYKKGTPYDSMQWSLPRIWTVNKTSSSFEKVEENIRFLRLVFPVKKNTEWNGNNYNTFPAKKYAMISIDKKEMVGALAFDSVVTVRQKEQVDYIQYQYEIEKYGRNVGLLYIQRDSIYHGGTKDSVGYMFVQKVVSYGKL